MVNVANIQAADGGEWMCVSAKDEYSGGIQYVRYEMFAETHPIDSSSTIYQSAEETRMLAILTQPSTMHRT